MAALLMERGGLQEGDHVALVYPPGSETMHTFLFSAATFRCCELIVHASPAGIDLIAAFYGSLYAGCVPITVRPPHPQNISTTLPTVKMIVEVRDLIFLNF